MTTASSLEAYDTKRALFKEFSTLTNGNQDFYGKGFDKIGRRHIARFETFNASGEQINVWMYITDIARSIKSGALSVLYK